MMIESRCRCGASGERAAIPERLNRYALATAGAGMVSAASTSAFAGPVPPMSASSAAGWSWSYTIQNNQLGNFWGPISWGANGTLLDTNLIVNPRRVVASVNNSFRDFAFSQAGWDPGVDYVYFGIGPVGAGAVIDANNTGAGLTAWTTGIVAHVFSTRTGTVNNTSASWVTQTARGRPTLGIGRGFFSFKIVDHGNEYFGWIELETVENANKDLTVTIHSWAYGTGSVTAPGTAPVPGVTGLAALACGAAGVRSRRRSLN